MNFRHRESANGDRQPAAGCTHAARHDAHVFHQADFDQAYVGNLHVRGGRRPRQKQRECGERRQHLTEVSSQHDLSG
jgi:hypothetical protein